LFSDRESIIGYVCYSRNNGSLSLAGYVYRGVVLLPKGFGVWEQIGANDVVLFLINVNYPNLFYLVNLLSILVKKKKKIVMNAFMHLVNDHLVPSLGILHINVTF